MNYSGMSECDVLNGTGFRVVLFVSGCSHHCYNCHNKETWEENNGVTLDEMAKNKLLTSLGKEYIDGLTLTGGDPLYIKNLKDVHNLINETRISFPSKTIWLYSGYAWEEIQKSPERLNILKNVDVLVDGRYIDSERDVTLKWRGSRNQRVIDVKKTLEQGQVVLWCE